jgi:hypothetical protein
MADETLQPKKRAFLAAYAETANITRAAVAAGVTRTAHYEWMRMDEDYEAAFTAAKEQAGDFLEAVAVQRATEGVEKPVTIAGQREVIREYSDTLLIFLLKGAKPDKYRERWSGQLSNPDGSPLIPLAALDALRANRGK